MNHSNNSSYNSNAMCDSSMMHDSSFTDAEVFMMSDCFGGRTSTTTSQLLGGYKQGHIRRRIPMAIPSSTGTLPQRSSSLNDSYSLLNTSFSLSSSSSRLDGSTRLHSNSMSPYSSSMDHSSHWNSSSINTSNNSSPVRNSSPGLHPYQVQANVAVSSPSHYEGRIQSSFQLTNNFGGARAA
ncbi:expressed unknown protein [Seminavis robusta]|uniref:Uncharacterized protein n=1 Tax=Seminavis robusta TaxID=568900 RepID=A0A9N8DV25_9STRA|nr:expressed unknown protein [Seminavis robusta]|eukprot:Sro379_g130380.1 n/a (182) ;mRNA; f:13065-13610